LHIWTDTFTIEAFQLNKVAIRCRYMYHNKGYQLQIYLLWTKSLGNESFCIWCF